jgi:hypothetical protein
MYHVIFYAALIALGYGAGRVHQWARFVAKAKAEAEAVVAEAKKV